MELKDFIKGTISDISLAVKELNGENTSSDLVVNPCNAAYFNSGGYVPDGRPVERVDFSLSVSAYESTEGGGAIKIMVLNAGVNNEAKTESVSIVKFSVPVAFPGARGLDPE